MTTETVTDYETQEVEREVTVCDRDGCEYRNADESEFVEVAVNPRYVTDTDWKVMTVFEYEDAASEALEERQLPKYDFPDDPRIKHAVSKRRRMTAAEAQASLDVCEQCFTTLFADVAVGDSSDVTVDGGEVTVTVDEPDWYGMWLRVVSDAGAILLLTIIAVAFGIAIGVGL